MSEFNRREYQTVVLGAMLRKRYPEYINDEIRHMMIKDRRVTIKYKEGS